MTAVESYFHNANLSIELATQLNKSARHREQSPTWATDKRRARKMRINAIRSLQYAAEMQSLGNWLKSR